MTTTSVERIFVIHLVILKIYIPSNKYRREKLIKIQRFWRRASGFEAAPIYRSPKNLGLFSPGLYSPICLLHLPGNCPCASKRRRFKWIMSQYLISHLYNTATKKQIKWMKNRVRSINICSCNGPDMDHIKYWWHRKEYNNLYNPFLLTSRKRIYELLARDTITPSVRMKASLFIQDKLAPY